MKSSFWHGADMPPLEGLSNFRGAVYDPVEGLQISKMASAEMRVLNLIRPCTHTCAHGTVWFASGGRWGVGGVGGILTSLT